jgi:hypothetical protein
MLDGSGSEFQAFPVLFYRDGFQLRQLSTHPNSHRQSEFINYIVGMGATRNGDWYKFPSWTTEATFDQIIKKALESPPKGAGPGMVYNMTPWPTSQ